MKTCLFTLLFLLSLYATILSASGIDSSTWEEDMIAAWKGFG
jgi:hypothetical protein